MDEDVDMEPDMSDVPDNASRMFIVLEVKVDNNEDGGDPVDEDTTFNKGGQLSDDQDISLDKEELMDVEGADKTIKVDLVVNMDGNNCVDGVVGVELEDVDSRLEDVDSTFDIVDVDLVKDVDDGGAYNAAEVNK